MGLHIRDSDAVSLYQDDTYSVWGNRRNQCVFLDISPRRLSMGFRYERWEQLRRIVAYIELPKVLTADTVVLHTSEFHIFCANNKNITWHLTDRQISVNFHAEDWEGFRLAVVKSGEPILSYPRISGQISQDNSV